MPTLEFKGKQYIYSHHHSVPFRELLVDSKKSLPAIGKKPSLDDNLIIHGDNLHALKALMPQYAGKIKCIYIDPPYNTGNEGWCYNDNVNSPLMKEWLKKNANPVDKEDLQRHDKWLCMMYPRLKLLHELLADDGVIFVSIDDNEQHHLRAVMDEIFSENNFLAQFIWKSRQNKDNRNVTGASIDHEYVIGFGKKIRGDDRKTDQFSNPDNDPRGVWTSGNMVGLANEEARPNLHYELVDPKTGINYGKPTQGWRYDKKRMALLMAEGKILWPSSADGRPRVKVFLSEMKDEFTGFSSIVAPEIYTRDGGKEIEEIFGNRLFDFPKPTGLLKELIRQACPKDGIILDSFSGSGTTAHAVLALNKEDGGNRNFILVEMEDYADTTTAERVRRVIKGVPTAKDEKLKAGLGGSFTFCELGKEISIEKIITGESLPDYGALAKYVFYTATGKSLDGEAKEKLDYFVGETDLYEVYLIYKPDIAFLRSNDSALNDIKLKAIAARNSKKEKLVFATAKYMGQKELSAQKITFCQLPYAIHKVVGA
jgi:adenine-specific DNA-methyltransferase